MLGDQDFGLIGRRLLAIRPVPKKTVTNLSPICFGMAPAKPEVVVSVVSKKKKSTGHLIAAATCRFPT